MSDPAPPDDDRAAAPAEGGGVVDAEPPAPIAADGAPTEASVGSPAAVRPHPPAPALPSGPRLPVRVLATLALAIFVATYVAVEVDLVRRHFPGIEPARYWKPQLEQVTLPGLGAGLVCTLLAVLWHKLERRRS